MKFFKSKNNIKKYLTISLFVLSFVFFIGSYHIARSSVFDNVSGFAWGADVNGGLPGGMGWLSFNCTTGGNCNTSDYGVNIDQLTGYMTGYAWTPNYGWLKFGGLSGFPSGPGTVSSNAQLVGDNLVGWARFCAPTQNPSLCDGSTTPNTANGGWDGWVSLSGSGYGITKTGNTLSGFAWGGNDNGSNNVGWIDFSNVSYNSLQNVPIVDLSTNAILVFSGQPANLSWTGNNLITSSAGCIATQGVNGWNNTLLSSPSGGPVSTGPLTSSTTFSIQCLGVDGLTLSNIDSVTIDVINCPLSDPDCDEILPPVCLDTNATNYGGPLPCEFEGCPSDNPDCCSTPGVCDTCTNPLASNVGQPLPCQFECVPGDIDCCPPSDPFYPDCFVLEPPICINPLATNYMGTLPCVFCPIENPNCVNSSLSFYAEPTTAFPPNYQTTLNWYSAEQLHDCQADTAYPLNAGTVPEWNQSSTIVAPNNSSHSKVVSVPYSPTIYKLTCLNASNNIVEPPLVYVNNSCPMSDPNYPNCAEIDTCLPSDPNYPDCEDDGPGDSVCLPSNPYYPSCNPSNTCMDPTALNYGGELPCVIGTDSCPDEATITYNSDYPWCYCPSHPEDTECSPFCSVRPADCRKQPHFIEI